MNILVTGASRGIGECIAKNLDGTIFAVGRNEEKLKQYENYLVCDFEQDIDKLGEYITSNDIDIIINNAGEYIYKEADKMDMPEIERIIRVNLEIPMYIISKTLPYMKQQQWGRIVNITAGTTAVRKSSTSVKKRNMWQHARKARRGFRFRVPLPNARAGASSTGKAAM